MAETKPNEPTAPTKGAKAKPKAADKGKPKLIIVRSTKPANADGSDPVILHEQDSRHPRGFTFVAGKTPVQVFPTPSVTALLREEVLKDITDGDDEPEAEEETEE